MTRLISVLIWVLGTVWLFRFNRRSQIRLSYALWLPTVWLFVGASRNVSEWLQLRAADRADAYMEGSPLDRLVLSAVLALGVLVLFQRRWKLAVLLRTNAPIVLYFGYCLVSVLWSDFPDVGAKRWFRALGDLVMVSLVLSETNWLNAFQGLFARLNFLLVPLSILLIRYYPDLGRTYSKDGSPAWTGVSTDKNGLGMLCLVFGLAAIFHFMTIWGEESTGKIRPLIAHGVLIAMTVYLIHEAHSATALACFVLGGSLMILTYLFRWARRPACLHLMVIGALAISISALFLGLGTSLLEGLGRESTLTGRTNIWQSALGQVRNPLLGTGFETFWLGPRLSNVSSEIHQGVNEAHNGYLEIYLNLGWVGVLLLAGVIVSGYRRIVSAVRQKTQAGSLRLAYFVSALAYNFSEAGFKMMNPVWFAFLLAIAVVPKPRALRRPKIAPLDDAQSFINSRTGVLTPTRAIASLPLGQYPEHRVPFNLNVEKEPTS